MFKFFVLVAVLVAVAFAAPSSDELLVRERRALPVTCMAGGVWDSLNNGEEFLRDCESQWGENNPLTQACFVAHFLHLRPEDLANLVKCIFSDN